MSRFVLVAGLCLTLLFAGFVSAEDSSPTLARIVESKTIRVGMSGNQPPFTMVARGGELIGFDVDLANALAAAMGVKLVLVKKPFAELLPSLQRGEVDMVLSGMTMTPERSLRFSFAGPYYVAGKAVLTKSPELSRGTQVSDFNKEGLVLVALDGSTSAEFIREDLSESKLVTASDYDAAIEMLKQGKAEGMIADLPALIVTLARKPEAGLKTPEALLTMEPIGVALPGGDPKLETFVSSLLTALDSTGKIDERVTYWFKSAAWLNQLP